MLKLWSFFLVLNLSAQASEPDLLQETVVTWSVPISVLSAAKELRVYAYDLGECYSYRQQSVVHASDKIPEGLLPQGAAMSAVVRNELEALVPKKFSSFDVSGCFDPHHFLAWFDEKGETVATAQVCFKCGGFELSFWNEAVRKSLNWPYSALQLPVNMVTLQSIFKKAGVPISLRYSCPNTAVIAGEWRVATEQLCLLKKQLDTIEPVLSPVERNRIRQFVPSGTNCVRLPNEIRLGGYLTMPDIN